MERTAFFPGIRIEKMCRLCGFELSMDHGCLAVRADAAKEKEFFRRINLLQAGLVMYAFANKEDKLLKACGYGAVYENPCAVANPILFDDWKSIDWIFTDKNQVSVFWFASFLTGKDTRSRFLSLYYALKTIAGGDKDLISVLIGCVGAGDTEEFLSAVERFRMEREDMEERGIEMPKTACDESLLDRMAEAWERLFEDTQ